MQKFLLTPIFLAFSTSALAETSITCEKHYFTFKFSNSYLGQYVSSEYLELGDSLATRYKIDYDASTKSINKIIVKNKSPEVNLVFERKNAVITHELRKLENRDEEFCASNPCRVHYEYIHAEMNDAELGSVASITIQIDNEIMYPDQVTSSSEITVGSFTLSEEADSTRCDGTILLERMDTSSLEEDLLE